MIGFTMPLMANSPEQSAALSQELNSVKGARFSWVPAPYAPDLQRAYYVAVDRLTDVEPLCDAIQRYIKAHHAGLTWGSLYAPFDSTPDMRIGAVFITADKIEINDARAWLAERLPSLKEELLKND